SDELLEVRLVNGDLAGDERADALRVAIHAVDMVADTGKASARHQTHVTATDNGNPHRAPGSAGTFTLRTKPHSRRCGPEEKDVHRRRAEGWLTRGTDIPVCLFPAANCP